MTCVAAPRRSRRSARAPRRGFTLIELMVVIVILGLLMGLVVPNLFGQEKQATISTAVQQMHNIGGAIDYYVLEHRDLPRSLAELTEPSPKTKEPFIRRIPSDPWNGAYEYRVLDRSSRTYQLVSAGEDRQPGTEDDLVFPESDPK